MVFSKGLDFIKRLLSEAADESNGSISVTDESVIRRFVEDPDFPFLVSFPRTGSHWLRMLMELYFERPSLVRVFYFKEKSDYLFLHTHDMGLDVRRKNVIYLFRNPAPTVFSQMVYEKEDTDDAQRIRHWAGFYGRHLKKWLIDEKESERKTIVRYEDMSRNLEKEFMKITAHFSEAFDPDRLKAAMESATKAEVKKKTTHDDKVVNTGAGYAQMRDEFSKKYAGLIEEIVFGQCPGLKRFFV
ncbi:MAG: sulfotransferase domain-containing protein [Deltaproteobacteria bacterium]